MEKKPKLIRIFSYLCLFGYICLALFLIYQATLDGEASSNASNTVGDQINNVIDDGKDKTKLVNPTNIIITNPITKINVGEEYKLKVDILPANSSYKSLIYTSSDGKIATIDNSGNIEFHQKGTVVISVCIKGFESISKDITVMVEEIPLEDFTYKIMHNDDVLVSEDGIYLLKQYELYEIDYDFNPSNSTNTTPIYDYDNTYIKVSNDVINANEATNHPMELVVRIDECVKIINYIIEPTIFEHIPVESFDVSKESIELIVGSKVKLSSNPFGISFVPTLASNQFVNYQVTDSSVITIKSNAIVGLKPGSSEIKIYNEESNVERVVEVVVKNLIDFDLENPIVVEQDYLNFDSNENVYKIRNGISGKISVNFTENSTYKAATYKSSNTNVLMIGEDGTITPLKVGKVKVIIEIDDGFDQKYLFEVELVVERTPLIEDMKEFYYTIRKSIGHFAAFFVLGMLGALAFSIIFDKKKWLFSIPMNCVLGFMIAGLTEFIQKYVPERYGCWDDVWLDYAGYISASVVFTGVVLLIYFFISARQHKNIE